MPVCLMMIVGAVLIGFIGYGTDQSIQLQSDTISAKDVGVRLFTGYVLLVEVAAFLLLGALVAAYHLGKKHLMMKTSATAKHALMSPLIHGQIKTKSNRREPMQNYNVDTLNTPLPMKSPNWHLIWACLLIMD